MEIYDMIKQFIKPELIIIIPVLYLIGIGIKHYKELDRYIPVLLGLVSIALTALYILATTPVHGVKDVFFMVFTAITQGVLLAGASVYMNQLKKQLNKTK